MIYQKFAEIEGELKWFKRNGLIRVKEEGLTGFSEGWQGCSEGFPEGEARWKSPGAALPAPPNPVYPDSFTRIYILSKIGF